jgi:hypothetical protein
MASSVAESELKRLIQVAHHKFSLLPAEVGSEGDIKTLLDLPVLSALLFSPFTDSLNFHPNGETIVMSFGREAEHALVGLLWTLRSRLLPNSRLSLIFAGDPNQRTLEKNQYLLPLLTAIWPNELKISFVTSRSTDTSANQFISDQIGQAHIILVSNNDSTEDSNDGQNFTKIFTSQSESAQVAVLGTAPTEHDLHQKLRDLTSDLTLQFAVHETSIEAPQLGDASSSRQFGHLQILVRPGVSATPSDSPKTRDLSLTQEAALEACQDFLSSADQKVMIITGQAGTGKTEMISEVVRLTQSVGRQVVLLAPTGQAARRLAARTRHSATTIHASIFERSISKLNGEEDPPQELFVLRKHEYDKPEIVFIIDESSFISDQKLSEENLKNAELIFGSSNLLQDILTFTTFERCQVIFVGDQYQLPPINFENAPALLPRTYEDLGFKVVHVNLVEMHRRSEDSPITKLGVDLVDQIKDHDLHLRLELEHNPHGGVSILPQPTLEQTEYDRIYQGNGAIVAWRHRTIAQWNERVRESQGLDPEIPQPGDLLILNQPLLEPFLPNGEDIRVVQCSGQIENITEQIRKEDASVPFTVQLVRAVVAAKIDDGSDLTIETFLVLNACLSLNQETRLNIRRVLWIDFVKRAFRIGLRPGNPQFIEMYSKDSKVHALRASYAYARTIHKSQGGEWLSVIADLSGVRGNSSLNRRLAYTAVTRARKSLLVHNWPFGNQSIDINSVGHIFQQFLETHANQQFQVRPIQDGLQIRSTDSDIIINLFRSKGRLGSIVLQTAPEASRPLIVELLRQCELEVRTTLYPVIEPSLERVIVSLDQHFTELGFEFYSWTPAQYQVSLCIAREHDELEITYFHKADGTRGKPVSIKPSGGLTLQVEIVHAIEEFWK